MATVRDVMTGDVACVRSSDTVLDAGRTMADLSVGALPVCREDGRLAGVITDRDTVVHVLAEGKDARAVHTGEVSNGETVTVSADDPAEEILRTMSEHKVRRLPVIDGHDLVGIVTQADVARALHDPQVGELLGALSQD